MKGNSEQELIAAVIAAAAADLRRMLAFTSDSVWGRGFENNPQFFYESLRYLVEIARKGDANVIAAFLGFLDEKPSSCVRREIIRALAQLAEKDNSEVIAAILDLLADRSASDTFTITLAIRTLGQLTGKGNKKVIAAIRHRLKDTPEVVRGEAIKALAQLAEKDNHDVIEAILDLLAGEDFWWVRNEAIKALAHLAKKDRSDVIAAILNDLVDPGGKLGLPGIRVEAVKALFQLTKEGKTNESAAAIRLILDDPRKERLFKFLETGTYIVRNAVAQLAGVDQLAKQAKDNLDVLDLLVTSIQDLVFADFAMDPVDTGGSHRRGREDLIIKKASNKVIKKHLKETSRRLFLTRGKASLSEKKMGRGVAGRHTKKFLTKEVLVSRQRRRATVTTSETRRTLPSEKKMGRGFARRHTRNGLTKEVLVPRQRRRATVTTSSESDGRRRPGREEPEP